MVTLDEAGAAHAWTRLHAAPARLAGAVELAWAQDIPAGAGCGWRIVADANSHLLAHRTRNGVRVRVVGARTRFVDAPMGARAWTVGVRLQPGTLSVIARVSAAALTDRAEDAEAVFGAPGAVLRERILEAETRGRVVSVLLDFVEHACRGRRPDPRIPALARALRGMRGPGRVRELAGATGLAERSLRQLCTDTIGFSPVRVARVGRLHRALELHICHGVRDWTRIAARAGYADQSHMIREFNALLGESPARFAARGGRTAAG